MKIYSIVLSFSLYFNQALSTCGIDNSLVDVVYAGKATIETYPWLGVLYYTRVNKRFTTAVVLVTRQMVLAAATEIDRLPKNDFRARARVVLGHNCSGPHLTIRDYTYHPDYSSKTFSALTLIQLETDLTTLHLRPICPPPTYFNNPRFYAMVLSNMAEKSSAYKLKACRAFVLCYVHSLWRKNALTHPGVQLRLYHCKDSTIMIYKMKYVSPKDCKSFYRRSNLDDNSIWPTHTACARSFTGGKCLWRSGAILVIKTGNRWRLLGFGVYGPGCEAPSRFLDYGMYHKWVERKISRIGTPSITTIADNHVVLRRMIGNIQRFGPCDQEEIMRELYSDTNVIDVIGHKAGDFSYNVSLYANVDYSCVTFKADYTNSWLEDKPKLRIQRWCAGSRDICYGFGHMVIHFHVTIKFDKHFAFKLRAYGQPAQLMDPMKSTKLVNEELLKHPKVHDIDTMRSRLRHPTYGPFVYVT